MKELQTGFTTLVKLWDKVIWSSIMLKLRGCSGNKDKLKIRLLDNQSPKSLPENSGRLFTFETVLYKIQFTLGSSFRV